MSPAHQLLETLEHEETVLMERRFDALADIQRRKEDLLTRMEEVGDADMLERIKTQAGRNERLMSTALTAIRGLKSRFSNIAQNAGNVGYAQDGSRVEIEGEGPNRRV